MTQAVPPMDEAAHKRLLVIIPAHNEGENIGSVLSKLLSLPMKDKFNILVIDDGSTDNTRAVCEEISDGNNNIAVVTHIYNMGYGMALKTAYKYAVDNLYDYVIQIDADGQHDVKNVERLYNAITETEGNAPDIVIGSRFLRDSVSFHIPSHKKLAIAVFRLLIRISTGDMVTDPSSGLQILNRRAFMFYAQYDNFAAEYPDANMIIQMLLNKFTIQEIPVMMHPRLKGESMHHGIYKPMRYVINMTISILAVWIRESVKVRRLAISST